MHRITEPLNRIMSRLTTLRASESVRTCDCGEQFAPRDHYQVMCGPCLELWEAKKAAILIESQSAPSCAGIYPPRFQDTDPARLPCARASEAVLGWKWGPRGLLLHGDTGLGKSRTAWLLLRPHLEAGRRIAVLNPASAAEFAGTYAIGAGEALAWIRKVKAAELVFLDDVLKCRMTDGFEAAMFDIVRHCDEQMVPVICTTNDTGASLQGRMSVDRAAPFIRRLRDMCDEIAFRKA